jgi:hypothetical protein
VNDRPFKGTSVMVLPSMTSPVCVFLGFDWERRAFDLDHLRLRANLENCVHRWRRIGVDDQIILR